MVILIVVTATHIQLTVRSPACGIVAARRFDAPEPQPGPACCLGLRLEVEHRERRDPKSKTRTRASRNFLNLPVRLCPFNVQKARTLYILQH